MRGCPLNSFDVSKATFIHGRSKGTVRYWAQLAAIFIPHWDTTKSRRIQSGRSSFGRRELAKGQDFSPARPIGINLIDGQYSGISG